MLRSHELPNGPETGVTGLLARPLKCAQRCKHAIKAGIQVCLQLAILHTRLAHTCGPVHGVVLGLPQGYAQVLSNVHHVAALCTPMALRPFVMFELWI